MRRVPGNCSGFLSGAGGAAILLDKDQGELLREIDDSHKAGNNAPRIRRGGRAAECAGLENRSRKNVSRKPHDTCNEQPKSLAPGLRMDADLGSVVEAWQGLDEPIRAAIVQLCGLRSPRHPE